MQDASPFLVRSVIEGGRSVNQSFPPPGGSETTVLARHLEGGASREQLAADLRALGVGSGDLVMVHASLRRLGPVVGGPMVVAETLAEVVGETGTLMAYVSWDQSPYEATLNGSVLSAEAKAAWPPFDPASSGVYPGFGALNRFLAALPGARRSSHPDASMLAVGEAAERLTAHHPLDAAYGPGSPLERFLDLGGRVLLLGAPPDALTVLHYAEAVAPIPGKRRVTYEMPVLGPDGTTQWRRVEDFDSNGILDIYAGEAPDAVELIARDYLALGRHVEGRVGAADAYLIDARDLVLFGVAWLVARHGDEGGDRSPPSGGRGC